MNNFSSTLTLFLSLIVEAMPFLLLGVILSGVLLLFIDERKLVANLPRHPLLGALAGGVMGFLLPVCECGNVPVARRLLMLGAPSSVAIGFLLAAPVVNPVVFWATWTAFRDQPEIALLRISFSLLIATLVGWVFSAQADLTPLLQPQMARSLSVRSVPSASSVDLLQGGTFFVQGETVAVATKPLGQRLQLLAANTVQEFRELGAVLLLGAAIATAVQVLVPREVVLSLGQGPISSIAAMMLLATIVSICSTVDSFFALSFASTFTSGSLLAFLVFGPMIDLKTVALLLTVFKKRVVLYLFLLAGQLTFLLTLFVNLRIS
ncbi:permease [Leptolyngbya sp. FACHB-261]|uniref:permease n=1 Tax=Leptolyngbya sp. FACHB-261 TaxID=2692806 RepID=UPI001681E62B|nr:permease [Leptolyngbya sp. FACHB-261]MBD2102187.1 permease [Leptolyngbya sp. FACHB-261]